MSDSNGSLVHLSIDNRALTSGPGQTVLEVARANGIRIPTLCFLDRVSTAGACRLCLVEVRGVPRLLPACCTEAAEGMQVTTQSARLKSHRRTILELLFAERNHICSVCLSNGRCELQSLAVEHGLTHTRFPYRFQPYRVDASHPRFLHDANRCVLCGRCVRVCEEIEGARTWNIMGRGIRSQLAADFSQPWGQAETCTGCGKCVHSCPTGALAEKGCAVGEMKKIADLVPRLASGRRGRTAAAP